ncbi:MAG: error-prone DNA polymerase [Alphaproteobacteria bacterium]|nr:error-prone DNA polymerase [Alphaproteobacteria bacterium]
MTGFADLACASHFSFLRGASPAQDLVLNALLLGHAGIGIADRNTAAGVVRAFAAIRNLKEGGILPPVKRRMGSGPGEYYFEPTTPEKENDEAKALREEIQTRAQNFKLVTGARLIFSDGTPELVAHAETRDGWATLCRLLTKGNMRSGQKAICDLRLDDVLADTRGLLLILMPPRNRQKLRPFIAKLGDAAPGALWLGATMPRRGDDKRKLIELKALGGHFNLPLIATNDVLYATPSQRDLQDILTCIREGRTIENVGRLLEVNAERHLKHPKEMARLFADHSDAILQTQSFLERVTFSLNQLRYEYPDEPVPPGKDAQDWLEILTWRHAAQRYPQGVPQKVENVLHEELHLIKKLDYARYFLTIHDVVRVAKDKGILCQGRGSAANSAVCYVLGITCVDPAENDLLFARFISEERREPPDIDVDFEHERREEIIQHIYERYGRMRAGLAATTICYRAKSAIRDVGKAFGLSEDVTVALSSTQWGSWGSEITDVQVRQAGLDPENPKLARAVSFAARISGFPRHLSQHVGGFVLTRGRLDELVPIGYAAMEDRTFIEWDKDDIATLGLMKVDVLALGMLTCIRKAFEYLHTYTGKRFDLASLEGGDTATYDMLCRGDSIGVFQVESRAQINMLPRLKPRTFYDLTIEVALVRPGPIQGNMVHPYLRRRSGKEKVTFPSPAQEHGPPDELRQVLGRTMGVPLFQEQAMKLAIVAAKFTDVEANQLRRAMATFRNVGTIHNFEHLMVERMVARGYDREFAANCFEQIKGFGSYGFPESHAASFAKLVYISSWIKCHHPTIFACALLNSQPMGFYAPAQIVRDAREHGVEVRPADVNVSMWDNTVEQNGSRLCLRLGFRQVSGIYEAEATRLIAARGSGFQSLEQVSVRARLYGRPMRALADADCFGSLGLDRRAALWASRRLPTDEPLPLFAYAEADELAKEPEAHLPDMSLGEHVATDYQTLRLSLKAHPLQVLRPIFEADRIATSQDIKAARDGARLSFAGIVLVRQRPGKGNAVFMTLEDEFGVVNAVLWARQLELYRKEVMGSRLMQVTGTVQKSEEGVIHLMVASVIDRSRELEKLWQAKDEAADITTSERAWHPRNVRLLPQSRDFH